MDVEESRQIMTRASYDAEARIVPNLGCAHETCHTGPSWLTISVQSIDAEYPFSVSSNLCESPSMRKTLIVLSEEHVARRFP